LNGESPRSPPWAWPTLSARTWPRTATARAHLAGGGTVAETVLHLQRVAGLARSTAQKYTRAAQKQQQKPSSRKAA